MRSSNAILKCMSPEEIKVLALTDKYLKRQEPVIQNVTELVQKNDPGSFKIHIDDPKRFLLFLKNVI